MAYRVHPGVVATIAAAADPRVQEAVDTVLATFWAAVADQAGRREGYEDNGVMVRAGLAAAPYLLRRGDWNTASALLEHALIRDESSGTVQAVLPALRRVAAATGTPEDYAVLARALISADPAEAERLLRGAVDDAAGVGHYRTASAAVGDLINLLRDGGRLAEALEAAGQKADYTRQAGLGPWTQLGDEGQRLQLLRRMGEHERVLIEVDRLRARMAELPDRPADNETVVPWHVREAILGTGYISALAVRDLQRCLDLNAEITASMRRRGAGVHEVTRTRFDAAAPLIGLGRLAEAERLLDDCQWVFEDHADTTMLARVFGTRASLVAVLGHWQAAADFARIALRLRYARPEPEDIAIGHYNLASYLGRLGGNRAEQRAHRFASALVFGLAGMGHDLDDTVRALADELGEDDDAVGLPSTVAEVVAIAGLTEGVRLGDLLAALQPDPWIVEDALAEILRAAAESAP
jgi:hypothetical protein